MRGRPRPPPRGLTRSDDRAVMPLTRRPREGSRAEAPTSTDVVT